VKGARSTGASHGQQLPASVGDSARRAERSIEPVQVGSTQPLQPNGALRTNASRQSTAPSTEEVPEVRHRSTTREDLDRALRALVTTNLSSLASFAPRVAAAYERANHGDASRVELELPTGERVALDEPSLRMLARSCEQQLSLLELREALVQTRTTRELADLSADVQRALQCGSPGGETSVRLPGGRTVTLPTTLSALRPLLERAYRIASQRENREAIEAFHVDVEVSLVIARLFPLVGATINAIELVQQRTITGRPMDARGNVIAALSIAGELAQLGQLARMGMRAQELALAVGDSGTTLRQALTALSNLSPAEVEELMTLARTMRQHWNDPSREALLASEQARAATLLRRGGLHVIVEGPNAGAIHAGRTARGIAPEPSVAAQATEVRDLSRLTSGEQFTSVDDMRAVAAAGERPPVMWERATNVLQPGEGATIYGQILASPYGTLRERIEVLLHEQVHRWLTSIGPSRVHALRTEIANTGYRRVQLLRYLEESLAQGSAVLRTRGVRELPGVLRFPFVEGYDLQLAVVGSQGVAAAAATAGAYHLERITIGPTVYHVFAEPTASTARTASAPSCTREARR
jgi:hypothetical protein